MDSTSVARQRIPLVVHKLSVPHCSPDCRPLLVLIRRPHCQSTPLPHLVHTIRTIHSSVCGDVARHTGNVAHHTGNVAHHTGNVAHHTGNVARHTGNVAHHSGECCTPQRGMLYTTPGNVAHHTGLGGPLAATSPLVLCSIAPRPSSAAVITRYRHLDWSTSWTCSSLQHAYWP